VRDGVCSAEDVDDTVTYGFGRRYNQVGPMAQGDLVGLDLLSKTHAAIFPSLCNDTEDRVTSGLNDSGKRGGKDLEGYLKWQSADHVEATKARRDNEVKRRLAADN